MINPTEIINQLKGFCSCVEKATDEDIAELVNVISIATCWMQKPCETFLLGDRREIIDLPPCADCPIIFEPFYHPFDVDTFEFSLITIEGIEETITPITEFAYHEADGLFHVIPGLPSCKCGCQKKCGCPTEYKLLVKYKAGYEVIPDCLLPVFCNVLEVIHAKNECNCCSDCGCEAKDENEIKYASGDVVSVALETDIGKMLVEDYKDMIGMMSLCGQPRDLWGMVV